MKFQKSLVFATILMTLELCRAHIGGNPIPIQEFIEPQTYCGRTLSNALALICLDAQFNEKRNSGGFGYNSLEGPSYKQEERDSIWSRYPPHHAHRLALPSRNKRYVVNECCIKPCSITELMYYC